jgi:thiamine biosynthesis lipoprotein
MPGRTEVLMGTLVTIDVGDAGAGAAIDRAFGWFHEIEDRCTRFDERSELMQLTSRVGVPVPASAIVFEALRFALHVAEASGGAFDPTVGNRLHARGFNREHRSGAVAGAAAAAAAAGDSVNYLDVELDDQRRTVTVRRPLTLDLGAVAMGLAIDTAARELQAFGDFGIDAGGDLYLGGCNPDGRPWPVGIRHPRLDGELIDLLQASDQAVCTSGDYERRSPYDPEVHHIIDPRSGRSPAAVASATVVAPGAMLADALATAAFVLGPVAGIAFLERQGVAGVIFTDRLERYATPNLPSLRFPPAPAPGERIRRADDTPADE